MIDLKRFKELALKELGIDLLSYKEDQLNRRLTSFFTRNEITDTDNYILKLKNNNIARESFIDYITINVTEFYRNPELYECLGNKIKEKKFNHLKVWSAACSNGCEPYGVAIMLEELNIKSYTIIATDLDPQIIKKAKEGAYEKIDLKCLPKALIEKYFTKNGDKFLIKESLKSKITFKVHDLLMDEYEKDFDLVLCRNVVIYFNTQAKDKLYTKISNSIKPNGLFFVGATENIHEPQKFNLKKSTSFIYEKK